MKLHSLNDIFERRILRIPDYQRGYAWTEHQIDDFWEDLLQLDANKIHYTGVVTLEPVKKEQWQRWDNDIWLIEDVRYKPYYVVDGQQRLTTSMILLQAMLETVPPNEQLDYQSIESIQKRFILFKADDNIRESYIFGYEKDNPSDEYLKTRIFGLHSHSNQQTQTLYTHNLSVAKDYFKAKLKALPVSEIALLFKKLTQKLRFNLYEIDDEIDVFVTFETMNNRGKKLTSLELLKNRLIYLSTLFVDNQGKEKLRAMINDAWKTMYEYLGRNPDVPLSDNLFLRNHWTMYFKYSRRKGDDYINFLLDEKFTARNVTHPVAEAQKLEIKEIADYVKSLQQSIVYWFYIHNPYYPQSHTDSEDNRIYLDRLNRLSFRSFLPLILAAYVSKQPVDEINKLLIHAERFNFTLFNLSQRRSNTGDTEFFSMARELLQGKLAISQVVENISQWTDKYFDPAKFANYIKDKYEFGNDGFYKWDGLRYFLFEYEQWLKARGKQATDKLSWQSIAKAKTDQVTIEHIFPQTPTDPYWQARFSRFSEQQQYLLVHSLGNLLPLSRAKNSSLQKDSFILKKNNNNGVGYYNGSAAENEVSLAEDWTAEHILERGLKLLSFLEQRWQVDLGDSQFKRELLHCSYLGAQSEMNINSGEGN